mgnify:CR=1 FL=1
MISLPMPRMYTTRALDILPSSHAKTRRKKKDLLVGEENYKTMARIKSFWHK